MEPEYRKLYELMDEAQGLLTALDGLLDDDFRSIRELRMPELYESNRRKETLGERLRELEAKWGQISNDLGRSLGLSRSGRTLSEVASRIDPSSGQNLMARRDLLVRRLQAVKEKGQANIHLLRHSVLRVEESLKIIDHFMNPGATYSSGGKLDTSRNRGSLFSSKA